MKQIIKGALLLAFLSMYNLGKSQDQFLHKDKDWIFPRLNNNWVRKEILTSESGYIYYTYKHKLTDEGITFYFNNCSECPQLCNMILISTVPGNLKAFSSLLVRNI